jgi:hypothetical protein
MALDLMKLPTLSRIIAAASMIGAAVALGLYMAAWWFDYIFGSEILWVWPSSIMLLATDGREQELSSYILLGFTVILNCVLYAAVATLAYCALWLVRRAAKRLV